MSIEIQCNGDPEDEPDEDDVDETESSSANKGMVSCSSKVEIDIFKYGSWVKQAVSSSFVTDLNESWGSKDNVKDKYKTTS